MELFRPNRSRNECPMSRIKYGSGKQSFRDQRQGLGLASALRPTSSVGENATKNPGRNGTSAGNSRRLPPTERRAIEILDAKMVGESKVRKAYKALIKILHR